MSKLNLLLSLLFIAFMTNCGGNNESNNIELEDIEGEIKNSVDETSVKFKIKVPKGAKKVSDGNYTKSYDTGFTDQIDVYLYAPGNNSMENLEAEALDTEGIIEEKKETDGTLFLLIKRVDAKKYSVYYVNKDKTLQVNVEMSEKYLEKGKEIAMSIATN